MNRLDQNFNLLTTRSLEMNRLTPPREEFFHSD